MQLELEQYTLDAVQGDGCNLRHPDTLLYLLAAMGLDRHKVSSGPIQSREKGMR
jgi:hypothetical protein